MTKARTMAWGTLAAAMFAVVAWAQAPAAGQSSAAQPPGGGYPATPNGGVGGFGGFRPGGGSLVIGAGQDRAQVTQLAQQYLKSTKEDEKKDIRKKLSDALGQQFDQLAEQQQKELDDLEKQVVALKALLKKRHDARDTIIDRRLDQVLQEAEGLGWGTHSGAPQGTYYSVPAGR
jgi:flagellar motility protein MotE (MotC chaperone)